MKFLLIFSVLLHSAHATLLYETDFENFTVGDNQWAGTEGWVITDNASGISFIDNTGFGGDLGKYGALGLEQPSSINRVSVLKQISHDHTTAGETIITIDAIISIRDSINGRYDRFYLSFFNANVKRMATIRFDNRDAEFGIWREQGNVDTSTSTQFDTFTDFIHEELDELFVSINLTANTWSASLSGLPLFENATFTTAANPADINLDRVGFEWQISAIGHGDNFLLVDDFEVNAFHPDALIPPTPIITHQGPEVTISWEAFSGSSYQIEYSDDLENWSDDLPDSAFDDVPTSGTITFTDDSAPATRYYRIALK